VTAPEDSEMAPELPIAFGGDGHPIPVDYPADPDHQERNDPERRDFEQRLVNFIGWLVEGGTVTTAGRKALLLAHFCGKSGCATDVELAAKMHVTRSRISQLRSEIALILPGLGDCNRRRI
jgi:hypothetical protein